MALKIHFLNVGHGDCTIIEHPSGRLTMVDINNGTLLDDESAKEMFEEQYSSYTFTRALQSLSGKALTDQPESIAEFATKRYDIKLTNPIDYYLANFKGLFGGTRSLWRFVATHPDLDHLCGIECLAPSGIEINNFWDTANTKVVTSFKSDAEEDAWNAYQAYRAGTGNHRVLRLSRGATGPMYNKDEAGNDGGDQIFILAPTAALTASAEDKECWNLHSYVLALKHAGRLVILGGDADKEAWQSIYDHYGDSLKCDVLKASHHGRDSGFHEEAVKAMSPAYTILSVGKKPSTDAHTKYNTYSDKVMSTRWYGNIVVTISDYGDITVTPEKDRDGDALRALLRLLK